jgi:hypothetical protein
MHNEIQRFTKLLEDATPILRVLHEEERLRPPMFNIFRVLGVATSEVKTHSALLAYLLDVNGNHGQGALFLNLFLGLLGERARNLGAPVEFPKADLAGWHCRSEVALPAGWGQVDILLTGPRCLVVIENKVYASDGGSQLNRYWRYARTQGVPFVLVYLTPHGVSPSNASLRAAAGTSVDSDDPTADDDSPHKHLILLSYREDIRLLMRRAVDLCGAISVSEILRHYGDLAGEL